MPLGSLPSPNVALALTIQGRKSKPSFLERTGGIMTSETCWLPDLEYYEGYDSWLDYEEVVSRKVV